VAHIQKRKRSKGTVYRAIIKNKGFKTITKTFSSRHLAVEFSKRIEGDREFRIAFNQSRQNKLSLSDLIDEYYLKKGVKTSRPQEESSKLKFWKKHLGASDIFLIKSIDISSALLSLPKHLSNATINRYRAAISVVFSYAYQHYELPENPVRKIPSLPENNGRTRYLSDDERTALLRSCRASEWDKLYLIVLMAITTGARKGELLNLTFQDIDFKRGTAYVKTTKNGEPKVLPLTDDVVLELNRFRQQKPQLIFNSEIKTSTYYDFYKLWKKALNQENIDNFRFHDLRHTCASYLAQSGASLLEIAEVLGHKEIQMTKRYSHLCIDHKSKLINRVMSDIK
jgi:integrase